MNNYEVLQSHHPDKIFSRSCCDRDQTVFLCETRSQTFVLRMGQKTGSLSQHTVNARISAQLQLSAPLRIIAYSKA